MKQVTQKAISAKVDLNTYAEMEFYCKRSEMKRNRLINLALVEYLDNHRI